MAIASNESTHILLISPPASAKTLVPLSSTRSSSHFVDCWNTTKAGVIDYLPAHYPRWELPLCYLKTVILIGWVYGPVYSFFTRRLVQKISLGLA
jgi:hypothetical protein